MGRRGGRHPDGLKQRIARTIFLRAPYAEWSALMHGIKREFRTPAVGAISGIHRVPTPVVLYARSPSLGSARHGLAVLVAHRQERLSDIAAQPESLVRENCQTYDEFRRYWRERTRRAYRPLMVVEVWTIAPWGTVAEDELGLRLLDGLYGDYIPGRDDRE